jgi:diacylglycerol kinase family enzyme
MNNKAVSSTDIIDWRPEDEQFWQATGKKIAYRNLWISIPALLCGFAVWGMWGIITVQMLNLGFPFTKDELFTLTAIAGISGATMRIPASFLIRMAGGRNTIFLTTAMLLAPAIGTGVALQHPEWPLWVFQLMALWSGVGGGNFASSMSNINTFFPKRLQGTALGLNAGLGNFGVTTMQIVIPLVMTVGIFGAFGGEAKALVKDSGWIFGKIAAGTPTYIQNAGFAWVLSLVPLSILCWWGMSNLKTVSPATGREVIETALRVSGRRAELLLCRPADLASVAHEAAAKALITRTAVVAVGGDGTLNTVAQAVHAVGCAMGVVPQGTFNYFARTHGIPTDPVEATRLLLYAEPTAVQVAAVNDRLFLVNASVGLYPDLLEDREAYKARFGRSRWVALWAASVTLLRAQRRLRLHIEQGTSVRDVRTLTLFVGNNRLQLEQLGVQPFLRPDSSPAGARITAVMLRPIGTLSMLRLILHGAMGTLGEAQGVERFDFDHMVVKPTLTPGRRGVKVAFDGEVTRLRAPLDFRVLATPLYLMKPRAHGDAITTMGTPETHLGGTAV